MTTERKKASTKPATVEYVQWYPDPDVPLLNDLAADTADRSKCTDVHKVLYLHDRSYRLIHPNGYLEMIISPGHYIVHYEAFRYDSDGKVEKFPMYGAIPEQLFLENYVPEETT